MNVNAFRITKTRFVSTAFDGEGARLYGGRWNSVGVRMVYLAGSLSSATLELLVHTDDYSTIIDLYSYFPVEIPESYIEQIDESLLPTGWNSPTAIGATQTLGDDWISSKSSVVLKVPSAISSDENNFLVNPNHPDFSRLTIADPIKFELDPRI